jgi:hypothetical protein
VWKWVALGVEMGRVVTVVTVRHFIWGSSNIGSSFLAFQTTVVFCGHKMATLRGNFGTA